MSASAINVEPRYLMARIISALTLLLLLIGPSLFYPTALVAQADSGVIRGQVINKTPPEAGLGGAQVTLESFIDTTPGSQTTTQTDSQGNFQFTGLATAPNDAYILNVDFQGVTYTSDAITFEEGETAKVVDLAVYQTTTEEGLIRLSRVHNIVEIDPSSRYLRVLGYFVFLNEGDRTYIGAKDDPQKITLRFSLPPGAQGLEVSRQRQQLSPIPTDYGFGLATPAFPGKNEVVFSYLLTYSSANYTLTQNLLYPTDHADFLIGDVGAKVASEQLAPGEPLQVGTNQFLRLSGSNFQPNTTLSVNLSRLPRGEGGLRTSWLIIGGIILVVALAVTYPLLKRRPSLLGAGSPKGASKEELEAERRDLLAALADLDDQFAEAAIPEATYRSLRQQKMQRLRELQEQLREL